MLGDVTEMTLTTLTFSRSEHGPGGLPLTLACIDIDAHADRLPYVVYHLLCSIPGICLIICVISVNAYMMKSLKEKVRKRVAKQEPWK